MSRAWIRGLTVGLTLWPLGCTYARYVPRAPIARGSATQHEVKRAAFDTSSLAYRLRVAGPTPSGATLTTANFAPCDAEAGLAGTLTEEPRTDDQQIEVTFSKFGNVPRGVLSDGVVDLYYADTEACERVPVGGYVLQYQRLRPWFLRAALDYVAPGVSGIAGMVGGSLGGGSWAGPVKLTAQVTAGSASCSRGTCPAARDDSQAADLGLTAGADALVYPWLVPKFPLGWGFGFGAGYRAGRVAQPAMAADRAVWFHSLQFIFAAAALSGADPVFQDGLEMSPSIELQLPVGIGLGTTDGDPELGFSIGFNLSFVRVL